MIEAVTDLVFAPVIPWPALLALAAVAAILFLWGVFRRARGTWVRAIPISALLMAVANPQVVQEDRRPLEDVAVLLIDESLSQKVGGRESQTTLAVETLRDQLAADQSLELRVERVSSTLDSGTRLFDTLERAIADVPRGRVAGAILITDGQVHDAPETPPDGGLGFPVHVLLTGEPDQGDRRLVVQSAPDFGLVGRPVSLTVRVEDESLPDGARVPLTITVDNRETRTLRVPVGRAVQVPVDISHAGQTVVALETPGGEDDLSPLNNQAALAINGVRDRLRVLLISGKPHMGERAWRNLLKSDPNVDLVHFTILRPPSKDDLTPLRELALIAFPIQELFEERLYDFDMIVFDRYSRSGLVPTPYMANVANYVRQGGALLLAVGPEFARAFQPVRHATSRNPARRAIGRGTAGGLPPARRRHRPAASGNGRHCARSGRAAARPVDPPHPGPAKPGATSVMTGAKREPLLLLDRVDEGRVALLLSDTLWLWEKGYGGGGPQAELVRRLAHWLMKEPDLEEEALRAEVSDGQLKIERRSLEAGPETVSVTTPSGRKETVTLTNAPGGRSTATLPVDEPGIYHISDGEKEAIAAAGAANPLETTAVVATDAKLRPVVEASGGGLWWLAGDGATRGAPRHPRRRHGGLGLDGSAGQRRLRGRGGATDPSHAVVGGHPAHPGRGGSGLVARRPLKAEPPCEESEPRPPAGRRAFKPSDPRKGSSEP